HAHRPAVITPSGTRNTDSPTSGSASEGCESAITIVTTQAATIAAKNAAASHTTPERYQALRPVRRGPRRDSSFRARRASSTPLAASSATLGSKPQQPKGIMLVTPHLARSIRRAFSGRRRDRLVRGTPPERLLLAARVQPRGDGAHFLLAQPAAPRGHLAAATVANRRHDAREVAAVEPV